MNDPNGTFMKRLLSTSQTEQLVSVWASALPVVPNAVAPTATKTATRFFIG
jgi:hypothetical protein